MHYRKTGEILPYSEWTAPDLDVPTFRISTDGEYVPSIEEIINHIRKSFSEFESPTATNLQSLRVK